MSFQQRTRFTLSHIALVGGAAVLVACGGANPSTLEVFTSKLTPTIASLNSSVGLASAAVLELFDDTFLDSGTTKTDVKASLDRNAAALSATPDISLFPLASMTNVQVTNCDTNNVCTLNGTLSNSDADTTEVAFTTKVKLSKGTYVFLGDQSAS